MSINKTNIVLDATMLDTLMVCPAKFNYRFNLNKVTPTKATPLDRGQLVHAGLETYYNALKSKQDYASARNAMIDATRVAGIESDLDTELCKRTLDVLIEYVNFWQGDDQRYEILAVEQPFSYQIHEDDDIRIIMIGKIDLLVNDNVKSYSNLPIDHKSYDRDYPVKRLTNQFLNYSYATSSNYLLVNKVGFQTSVAVDKKMKRVPLSYDPLILEQWKQNVIKWAYQYLGFVADNSWPLNLTSCDKYNRVCEYFEVCDTSGEAGKEYKLNVNFKTDEPWDVAKSLGLKDKTNGQ